MPQHVLLNNVDHKDLKIIRTRAAAYGDALMYAQTFPAEFRNVQAHYPIFFAKDGNNGAFSAVAMFGFEQGENLFLNGDGWDAHYVPFTVERQPFLIGRQHASDDNSAPARVIHIDMQSPRISQTEGEPVFLAHGGNTDYLNNIAGMLEMIHQGLEDGQAFCAALVANDLLESFTLDVELDDGSQNRLAGFYTVNEDKLATLDADALGEFNAKGMLQPLYMTVASLSNLRDLIERKNGRQRATPAS